MHGTQQIKLQMKSHQQVNMHINQADRSPDLRMAKNAVLNLSANAIDQRGKTFTATRLGNTQQQKPTDQQQFF